MNKNSIKTTPVLIRPIRTVPLSAAFLIVFLYGVGVGIYRWPPFSNIRTFKTGIMATYDKMPRMEGRASQMFSTYRRSYFKLDGEGRLELHGELPIRAEGVYRFQRILDPKDTAIVIMDPWEDMASDHLNGYYQQVIESRLIPLATCALTRGHPIIILTNDPAVVEYNGRINSGLEALVKAGRASVLYHQDYDDRAFATYLHSQGIKSLIYTGFASNMCVIGRSTGMISMGNRGFNIFFVPEASAAVEYSGTWKDGSIHKATTTIISQGIAEIIDYDEFMKTSSAK